jgi:hypothetical protein
MELVSCECFVILKFVQRLMLGIFCGVFPGPHLLTELSPSGEAASCAATQERPSILRNPKVHHRVHLHWFLS